MQEKKLGQDKWSDLIEVFIQERNSRSKKKSSQKNLFKEVENSGKDMSLSVRNVKNLINDLKAMSSTDDKIVQGLSLEVPNSSSKKGSNTSENKWELRKKQMAMEKVYKSSFTGEVETNRKLQPKVIVRRYSPLNRVYGTEQHQRNRSISNEHARKPVRMLKFF